MIVGNKILCPKCGGCVKHYDSVNRIVKIKYGVVRKTRLKRFRCVTCRTIHRQIPNYILPYKHYEAEIIIGVVDGFITPETLGFEDFPSEATMSRWIALFANNKR